MSTVQIKYNLPLIAGLVGATAYMAYDNRVRRYAKQFLGEEEIPGNLGFESAWFQNKMANVGWKKGDAWCVYFIKVLWTDMFPEIKDILNSLISGNSQRCFENFKTDRSGLFKVVDDSPKKDDIVIWQYYKNSNAEYKGHAGVVTRTFMNTFWTVEGNTRKEGGGREGLTVSRKKHKLEEMDPIVQGLRLRGFIRYKYA